MRIREVALWADSAQKMDSLKSAFSSVFGNENVTMGTASELVYVVAGEDEERYVGYTKRVAGMTGPSRFLAKAQIQPQDRHDLKTKLETVARLLPQQEHQALVWGNAIAVHTAPRKMQDDPAPDMPALTPVAA